MQDFTGVHIIVWRLLLFTVIVVIVSLFVGGPVEESGVEAFEIRVEKGASFFLIEVLIGTLAGLLKPDEELTQNELRPIGLVFLYVFEFVVLRIVQDF